MTENQEKKSVLLEEIKYIPSIGNNQLKPEDESVKPDTWFLMFTVLTGTSLLLTGAGMFVWTSPAIPLYLSNDTLVNPLQKPITTIEISLLAGIPALVSLIGPLLVALLSDKMGRKRLLQTAGLGMLICVALTVFIREIMIIIIARCLFFLCYAIVLTILPIYITEICDDNNRTKYGCICGMILPLGNLYMYLIGSYFTIEVFTALIGLPSVYFLIFFFFAPESPSYLLTKGKKEECLKVLTKLRSNKSKKELEIDLIKIESSLKSVQNSENNFGMLSLFKTRIGRVGLVLALIPVLINWLSGIVVIGSFLAPIFNEIGGSISGNTVSIIVGTINVFVYAITAKLVEKFDRRHLLITSMFGTSFSLLIFGLYLYLKNSLSIINNFTLIPLFSIVLCVIFFSIGLGPIPGAIVGEFFAADIRSVGVSFIATFSGLMISILGLTFPILNELIGLHWCLWIFAFNVLIGVWWVYKYLPETKGKSIAEVQDMIREYKF